ncbi:hypothetical protein U9954_18460 [Escherichia coli]
MTRTDLHRCYSPISFTVIRSDTGVEKFDDSNATFFGVYGAGIEKGKAITITLNNAVASDDQIQWKASLPVTVTYM